MQIELVLRFYITICFTNNYTINFQVRRRGFQEMATRSIWQRSPVQELATLPEVRQERAPLLRHQDSSIRNTSQS